jgi:hypothetical protein
LGAALAAATVCVLALVEPAGACGDKLVALGGGVGFERIIVSRNPGHIVMLLEPGSGLAAANEKFNIAASLNLAGHEVVIAKSVDELRSKQSPAPDLIMVDASRAKSIAIPAAAGGTAPVIMPVEYFADGSTVPASYRPASCVTVADGRKGATVLKAVEHTLKLRSRGQTPPCQAGAPSQQT